jgi:protein-arginine kinase activator protein McsA
MLCPDCKNKMIFLVFLTPDNKTKLYYCKNCDVDKTIKD